MAEVHDAMAPARLRLHEELGLCKEGESPRLTGEGRAALNGDIVVNPSGDLADNDHPIGATGLAHVSEIVWQLRGKQEKGR